MSKILKATHSGDLHLPGGDLPCFVLEDGRRVLSGRGMQSALDLGQKRGQKIQQLIGNKSIKPLIDTELELGILQPIEFITPGKFKAFGYEADSLVDLCRILLEARKRNILPERYIPTADKAEILMVSFAKIGIIALVDEATGYQYDREKDELQKILSAYIAEELLPWQKRFPDEFYKEIFRLNGWDYTVSGIKKRPGVIGTWTKQLVYNLLPKGVLEELERVTPKSSSGNKVKRLHQSLSLDIGEPHLERQLISVITLMNISNSWKDFIKHFQKKFAQVMMEQGLPANRVRVDSEKTIMGQQNLFSALEEQKVEPTDFNKNLKGVLSVPPPKKDK